MLSNFFGAIVTFLAGAILGFVTQLLPSHWLRKALIGCSVLMLSISLIWIGYEMGRMAITSTPHPLQKDILGYYWELDPSSNNQPPFRFAYGDFRYESITFNVDGSWEGHINKVANNDDDYDGAGEFELMPEEGIVRIQLETPNGLVTMGTFRVSVSGGKLTLSKEETVATFQRM